MIPAAAERLQFAVAAIADEIKTSMAERSSKALDERQLWRELSSCILSSQVPYELALAYSEEIDRQELLRSSVEYDALENELRALLLAPICVSGRLRRYRFPCVRAAQLMLAKKTIAYEFGSLSAALIAHDQPSSIREYLVRHIPGVGPKQASMFLRNVSLTYDMAIMDRHVLEYMAIIGIGGDLSTASFSLKTYERREQHFRGHAADAGYEVGIYDWAVWIVMRAAKSLEAF